MRWRCDYQDVSLTADKFVHGDIAAEVLTTEMTQQSIYWEHHTQNNFPAVKVRSSEHVGVGMWDEDEKEKEKRAKERNGTRRYVFLSFVKATHDNILSGNKPRVITVYETSSRDDCMRTLTN